MTEMRLNDYVAWTENTSATLGSTELDNFHMLMGMMTEVGELTDAFKKYLAYKQDIDWVNVKEEVGDLMWYIAGFCRINNFDLEYIIETNMGKLNKRYPKHFTEESANNRNLKEEREILEKSL